MSSQDDQEHVSLATSLVNPDDVSRQAAINGIRAYVASIQTVADLDMMKLWKGLYYSLWLCDKTQIQNQLAEEISRFIHVIKVKATLVQFISCFSKTLIREWALLDQYRVNKFYNLLRYMLRESFIYLKRANWNRADISMIMAVIDSELLKKIPNGPRFHIIDTFLEELHLVAGAEITNGQFMATIQTFLTTLKSGIEMIIVDRILNGIFRKYIEKYATEVKNSDMDSGDESESKATPFVNVKTKNLQQVIFDIASSEDTNSSNRRKLYDLHKQFPALTGVAFVEETFNNNDDDDEASSSNIASKSKQTPKKSRKIDEISTPAASTPALNQNATASAIKFAAKGKIQSEEVETKIPVVATPSDSKSKKAKVSEPEPVTEPIPTPASAKKNKPAPAAAVETISSKLAVNNPATENNIPKKSALKSSIPVLASKSTASATSTSNSTPTTATNVSISKASTATAQLTASPEPISSGEQFISAKKFTGKKEGYFFGSGKQGLGYYLDSGKSKAKASSAPAVKSKGVTFGKNKVTHFSTSRK
jgi:ribosomal RNA-processing protein 1